MLCVLLPYSTHLITHIYPIRRRLTTSQASVSTKVTMKLENSNADVLDLTHSPSPSFKTPIKQEDNSANFLDLMLSPSPVTNTPIKLKNNVDILDLTHSPLPLPSPLNHSTDILDLMHMLLPICPMPFHSLDHETDDDSAVIQFPGTLPCDCSSLSLNLLQCVTDRPVLPQPCWGSHRGHTRRGGN